MSIIRALGGPICRGNIYIILQVMEPFFNKSFIQVLIVGNGAVGKSSMIQRYSRGTFTKSYKKTIGVDFLEKQLRTRGEDVRLMLWDTAGQEEFDAITKAYYRGAQACVVAFSTTDRDSLMAVRKWRKKVEDECGDIPMVLVQNKIDLIAQSQVSTYESERMASDCRMKLYRTSVKEDLNVDLVFQHLAENYVKKVRSSDSIDSGFHSLSIGLGPRRRQPGRSRSRERRRLKCSPSIAEYLNNPMFDSLHGRLRPTVQQQSGLVSQCKVL